MLGLYWGLCSAPGLAAESSAPAGEPLRVRNLSPATQLFGLPRPYGAAIRPGVFELSLIVEHGNNFTGSIDYPEDDPADPPAASPVLAIFDGSTTVTTLGMRGGAGRNLEWGVELPYVHHSGGITDGLIEGWHDLFDLPNSGRERVPRDRIDYRIELDGTTVEVDRSGGHLGDLRGWLGYRLQDAPNRQAALRLTIKAPTGRLEDLSGSEGVDASLAVELVDAAWLDAIGTTVTVMAALTALGGGELAPAAQREVAVSGHLGLHYPLTRSVTLRAQLDGHSEVLDTGMKQVSGWALLGTLGGTIGFGRRAWLDLGLSEDLTGDSASDVVFLVTLGARL